MEGGVICLLNVVLLGDEQWLQAVNSLCQRGFHHEKCANKTCEGVCFSYRCVKNRMLSMWLTAKQRFLMDLKSSVKLCTK